MSDSFEHMRSKPGDSPTPRQAEMYTLILKHFAEHGSAPTIREVATMGGMVSPNGARSLLVALHKKGLVVFEQNRSARSIAVPAIAAATKAAAAKLLAEHSRRPMATTPAPGIGNLAKNRKRK